MRKQLFPYKTASMQKNSSIAIPLSIILLLAVCWPFSPAAGAGFVGPGSPAEISCAADALKADDDTPCVLEGRIKARVQGRKNRYIFEDSSGQVIVEIKKKVFGNLTITPENFVRLEGEVEADDKYPNEVEVDHLFVLSLADAKKER